MHIVFRCLATIRHWNCKGSEKTEQDCFIYLLQAIQFLLMQDAFQSERGEIRKKRWKLGEKLIVWGMRFSCIQKNPIFIFLILALNKNGTYS